MMPDAAGDVDRVGVLYRGVDPVVLSQDAPGHARARHS